MSGLFPGDSSHNGIYEGDKISHDKSEEAGHWYLSRKEIEDNSPSKHDGIDLKKEAYLRKSYCSFLQELGMKLKVPQVTIATAIIFCHRFFLHQSHAKNDRRTIATACMFLAGKVEETPRPLKDVIFVSYEIINKKDPVAVQKIKQKEVYEQQKELILTGERVVLATLGFDFNVNHPYKPLVEAIKKFKVAQNALAQVAWNFVNDGLRTSLCLQFKPHHVAAGAIFLAAKFLKVKLPSDGERVWWQEFDVTPRQLEEVSNQMLELYEQNRVQPSHGSEVEGSAGGGASHRGPSKAPTASEEHVTPTSYSQAGGTTSRSGISKAASSRTVSEQSYNEIHNGIPRTTQNQSDGCGSTEMKSGSEPKSDGECQESQQPEPEPPSFPRNTAEAQNISRNGLDGLGEEDQERNVGREAGELKDKHISRNLDYREGTIGQSPHEALKKIDKEKLKAKLEKRKKFPGNVTRKIDSTDEDDLIERELESGIELAAESEKAKRERRQSWPTNTKPLNKPEDENTHYGKHQKDAGPRGIKGQLSRGADLENVEEGEVSVPYDASKGILQSPKSSNRKRKIGIPPEKPRHDYINAPHHSNHNDYNHAPHHSNKKRHLQDNIV